MVGIVNALVLPDNIDIAQVETGFTYVLGLMVGYWFVGWFFHVIGIVDEFAVIGFMVFRLR